MQKQNLSSEESALQKHLLQTTPLHPDIFFLYWDESPDFGEINRLVVRWLVGLGHKVFDLADEMLQEEMTASPECWVLEKLENPNIKVIVVESETKVFKLFKSFILVTTHTGSCLEPVINPLTRSTLVIQSEQREMKFLRIFIKARLLVFKQN